MGSKVITTNTRQEFVSHICNCIKKGLIMRLQLRVFTLVLSGGRTKSYFKELVKNYKKNIDWKNVHLFWVDERCVSPFHDDSNYKLANDNLISKLSLSLRFSS